jgi:hypothetical protein
MKKLLNRQAVFAIIIVLFGVYVTLFILRTSFVIADERYFSLFDDAMISMQYAKNLAEGSGLVWHPSVEPIEGFTNPLWVLIMAFFHLIPAPASKISLMIQSLGALILLVNLFVVKRIADLIFDKNSLVSLSAVVLTAFYLPLNNWTLQGMEVGLLTLILGLAVVIALRCLREGKPSLGLYILLGVSTLVRIDMAVPALTITIFLALVDKRNCRRHLRWGVGILVVFLGLQTLFRLWYFGDALPNTYYLKMTGYPLLLRWTRGLAVTWDFIWHVSLPLFLLPFMLLFWRRDKQILLLISLFMAAIGYSIYVGGDAWEYWGCSNRYITMAMPLFFILFCGSTLQAESWLLGKLQGSGSATRIWVRSFSIIVLLIALLKLNLVYSPYGTLEEWLLIEPPLAVNNNRQMVEQGLLLKSLTDSEAKIAVVWAGAIPYFSERAGVDILGKNDAKIARMEAKVPDGPEKYTAFYPGHMKWDYGYSITEQKPDVIAQLYGVTDLEIDPYLAVDYWKVVTGEFVFHMHMDSEHIDWDKVNTMGKKWRHEKSLERNEPG